MFLSIFCYAIGVAIQQKTGSPLCNPLLIASVLVGVLLIVSGTTYQTYEESGQLISFFLTPATVALAIPPIYRKLDVLHTSAAHPARRVRRLACIHQQRYPVQPSSLASPTPPPAHSFRSRSRPRSASRLRDMLGGVTSITAIAIVITGIFGAILLPTFLKVHRRAQSRADGLSISTAAHAVGTSRAIQLGETEGAISGLAIGVAGLLDGVYCFGAVGVYVNCRRRRGIAGAHRREQEGARTPSMVSCPLLTPSFLCADTSEMQRTGVTGGRGSVRRAGFGSLIALNFLA